MRQKQFKAMVLLPPPTPLLQPLSANPLALGTLPFRWGSTFHPLTAGSHWFQCQARPWAEDLAGGGDSSVQRNGSLVTSLNLMFLGLKGRFLIFKINGNTICNNINRKCVRTNLRKMYHEKYKTL